MRVSEEEYQKILAGRGAGLAKDLAPVMRPGFGATLPQPRAGYLVSGSTKRGAMNKTEARYASEVLDVDKGLGKVAQYWYESIKLRLADGAWFTVDFFVMLADGRLEAHEIKGFWREAAKVRIKVAAELYPFKFVAAQRVKKKEGGGWKIVEY
jgi:hypothetical protein